MKKTTLAIISIASVVLSSVNLHEKAQAVPTQARLEHLCRRVWEMEQSMVSNLPRWLTRRFHCLQR